MSAAPDDARRVRGHVCPQLAGQRRDRDDVGDGEATPRGQDAEGLAEHRGLVGRQVDHAVRDDHVDAGVCDGQVLDLAEAELDVGESRPSPRWRAPWRASRRSCRRRSRGRWGRPGAPRGTHRSRRRCRGRARARPPASRRWPAGCRSRGRGRRPRDAREFGRRVADVGRRGGRGRRATTTGRCAAARGGWRGGNRAIGLADGVFDGIRGRSGHRCLQEVATSWRSPLQTGDPRKRRRQVQIPWRALGGGGERLGRSSPAVRGDELGDSLADIVTNPADFLNGSALRIGAVANPRARRLE